MQAYAIVTYGATIVSIGIKKNSKLRTTSTHKGALAKSWKQVNCAVSLAQQTGKLIAMRDATPH